MVEVLSVFRQVGRYLWRVLFLQVERMAGMRPYMATSAVVEGVLAEAFTYEERYFPVQERFELMEEAAVREVAARVVAEVEAVSQFTTPLNLERHIRARRQREGRSHQAQPPAPLEQSTPTKPTKPQPIQAPLVRRLW